MCFNFTSVVYVGSRQLLCIPAVSMFVSISATCFTLDSASFPRINSSVSCDTSLKRLDVIEQTLFEICDFRLEVDDKCACSELLTQLVVIISYRRFGTTYRSRNVGEKLQLRAT